METNIEGPISLKDFLEEAELQQYHELFRDVLKINKTTQLKFVNSVDLTELGLSKPEQRRYKKLYTKYFGKHYFTKIKKLLKPTKRNETSLETPCEPASVIELDENSTKISTKHIIPVEDITINKELGTGEFGVVQQGTWTNNNKRIQVAIKCLGREKMNSNSFEFLKEAAVMHSIEHASVVRLYGVVLHLDSLMLVTELAPLRSLLECLKEYNLRESFPVPTLCNFAEQICEGMTYLESKRLIHRDLAARNILVFNKNKVKISDFGLSRALGVGKDYYQTNYNVNLKLPVAWCAAECITYLRFTSASDIWAYAVTLWEMFSYGFQPWAAFSGQQILMAIDEPNFQRLERPECCPEQYYASMIDCWAHEPASRPRFKDLNIRLRNIRPEQVIAKSNSGHIEGRRATLLNYKAGEQITVIGKERLSNSNMWVGVLQNGACGLFNPETTVPYTPPQAALSPNHSSSSSSLGSPKPQGFVASALRSSLVRSDSKRHTYTPKRTIQREMISAPQGDVKHMGHVGLDGAHFGDVSFLNENCSELPRQVVNPYKPSEDLEETPLLNPNSPSHLTGGASTVPPFHILTGENVASGSNYTTFDNVNLRRFVTNNLEEIASGGSGGNSKSSSKWNGFKHPTASRSFISKVKSATLGKSFRHEDKPISATKTSETAHEYQEIDNDSSLVELPSSDSVQARRSQTDFSQSLIDEMECMFQSLNVPEVGGSASLKKGVVANQRAHTLGSFGKKKAHSGIVKPMSAHEQKTLETAVALANELTTKSMNDLDSKIEKVPPSPNERSKFHFKFPSISHPHTSQEHAKDVQSKAERRNFSQEAQSVPDLQSTITKESRLAYTSLIEHPKPSSLITQIAQDGVTSHQGTLTLNKQSSIGLVKRRQLECSRQERPSSSENVVNQGCNVLPLPSKGSKPLLVEKIRHVRIHPLVITDTMKRKYDVDNKAPQIEQPNFWQTMEIPTVKIHDYQNFVDTNNGGETTINYLQMDKSLNIYQKCRPDPEYINIYMNAGVDVCDGPSKVTDNGRQTNNLFFSPLASEAAAVKSENVDNEAVMTTENSKTDSDSKHLGSNSDLGSLLKDAPDHVSVEDLLEFADQKPCGRQRGTESDEVRILCKVLNYEQPKVTKEDCVEVLDYTEWKIHAALKLFRLRNELEGTVTLRECAQALEVTAGDVAQATTLLRLG